MTLETKVGFGEELKVELVNADVIVVPRDVWEQICTILANDPATPHDLILALKRITVG